MGLRTHIQGIVNVTPDSFSNDGCWQGKNSVQHAVRLAQKQIREGADIIDIGGESTRPGAKPVDAQEEIERVIPVIKALTGKVKVPLSVDTYKPAVAQAAMDAGACILNTILGANPPARLLKMARDYNAVIILMHMRGTPRTMQTNIHYQNVITDIMDSLGRSIEKCLEAGIKSDKIIVDPGIGFGKTAGHNLEILNRLNDFNALGRPLLIGTSRKSFIGAVLSKDVSQRLFGTAATVCASILNGAHIVRVHDVKAMRDIALMTDAILNVPHS